MEHNILLRARNLSKDFRIDSARSVHAVSDVSLDLFQGQTLALVGESGCGKSTLGRTLIGLYQPTSGTVSFREKTISGLKPKEFRPYRRQMQIIFQDPYASLDPRMTVRDIIAEPLKTYHACSTKQQTTARVLELLQAVGLSQDCLNRYPHQFSGGQRQRIGIARAIALQPALIVCDEPVSALDVSVQNQILNLLRALQTQYKLTYLFISHDLSVVRFISERVAVMFLGRLCEVGPTQAVFQKPLHPYTRFLLEAVPKPDPLLRNEKKQLLSGELPSPIDPPAGCRFCTRCPFCRDICRSAAPELRTYQDRSVACHRADDVLSGTI